MDKSRRARVPLRAFFIRTTNEILVELSKEDIDFLNLNRKVEKLDRLMTEIREWDRKVLDELLDGDASEETYTQESEVIEGYEDRFSEVKFRIKEANPATPSPRLASPVGIDCGTAVSTKSKKRTFTLPKLEIRKFSGDLKDWLGFWAQFKNIDGDEELDPADEFQYLIQSMVKGSRARELVDSYPQSSENYSKAVSALKERFGKDELLIEVYVRELLKLVISNTSKSKEINQLSTMYDRLESHLRALETMGVTSASNAAMLFPLVESSLSENVLQAWHRSSFSVSRDKTDKKTRLDYLMEFLKIEVDNQERMKIARDGFRLATNELKKPEKTKFTTGEELPTAAGLHVWEAPRCIFCKKSHDSRECVSAQAMSLEDRRKKVMEKRCCYN